MAKYPPNTLGAELTTLAFRAGMAEESSDGYVLPSDPVSMDILLRAFQDAAKDFYTERQWFWSCPTVSLTLASNGLGSMNVNGESTRYRLGESVLGGAGRVVIGQPSSVSCNSVICPVVEVHDTTIIRRNLALNQVASGPPVACGIEYVGDGPNGLAQHDLVVWPRPDSDYTLTFRIAVTLPPLTDLSAKLPWGEVHARTVMAGAELQLALGGQRGGDATVLREAYRELVKKSAAVDELQWPRNLGVVEFPNKHNRMNAGTFTIPVLLQA